MANRRLIPKPRHLFPETAAFIISVRRSLLYMGVGSRVLFGSIPPWIAGALAGIASLMLTISLFFMGENSLLVAAPQSTIPPPVSTIIPLDFSRIQPIETPLLNDFPAETIRRPLSNLTVDFQAIGTAQVFSNRDEITISSNDQRKTIPQNLNAGDWRAALKRSFKNEFIPYVTSALRLDQMNVRKLEAADTIPIQFAPSETRGMGVYVSKPAQIQGHPNEPITYEIDVMNVTDQTLDQLIIRERVSELARVTEVVPMASLDNGDLVWVIDDFQPSASRRFTVTLVPEVERPITSRTTILPTISFSKGVLVTAAPEEPEPVIPQPAIPTPPERQPPQVAGKPDLRLTYTPLPTLRQDDNLAMTFSITNVGTAPAENIELYVRLTDHFEHRYGDYVHHKIDRLEAGQTRRAFLAAIAKSSGQGLLSTSLTMQGAEIDARTLRIFISPKPDAAVPVDPVASNLVQ